MCGTSVDAIDAALVDFREDGHFSLLDTRSTPISTDLRTQIQSLFEPGENEIDRLGELDRALGFIFADAVNDLLKQGEINPQDIQAIGSHGQTIRHRPTGPNHSFTLQIGDPNTIAEGTGIRTVADFRRRDVAAAGQGAPLAPEAHRAFFSDRDERRIILNIGGIANITDLSTQDTTGFDTGPGNGLMDTWCQHHGVGEYDEDGRWANSGEVDDECLARWLNHPFFDRIPPKSTGKEEFSKTWLLDQKEIQKIAPENVQATLLSLTSESIARAIDTYCQNAEALYVCGGGAHNHALMTALRTRMPQLSVQTTESLGIGPDWVEAAAFAWPARNRIECSSGNIPKVTGAKGPRILGGVYSP